MSSHPISAPVKNNGEAHCPQHPFVQQAGSAPVSKERTKRKNEQKGAQRMMDAIIIAGVLFAIVPQIIFELWVFINPNWEFSWHTRDSFFLFSVTSHLTSIVIMLASIAFVRIMGKQLDTYDELLERGMSDYERMKSRLVAWSFDLDSFSEAMDDFIEVYHTYKKDFKEGVAVMRLILPAIPALKRKFGTGWRTSPR
jgi:hypothetical protein